MNRMGISDQLEGIQLTLQEWTDEDTIDYYLGEAQKIYWNLVEHQKLPSILPNGAQTDQTVRYIHLRLIYDSLREDYKKRGYNYINPKTGRLDVYPTKIQTEQGLKYKTKVVARIIRDNIQKWDKRGKNGE